MFIYMFADLIFFYLVLLECYFTSTCTTGVYTQTITSSIGVCTSTLSCSSECVVVPSHAVVSVH